MNDANPTVEVLSKQIQAAIKKLPERLDQQQVEALLMTIAQGYAPDLETAVDVLINAATCLQDYIDIVEEAQCATIQ
jgi:hypothetical protein